MSETPRDGDQARDDGGEEQIPLGPSSREPQAKITRESLLASGRDEPDVCPSCSAPLPGRDAVVCLECGYDIKANRKVRTKVGVAEVEEDGVPGEFCRAGMFSWQALAIAGGLCIVAACVLAVMQAEAAPAMALLRVLVYSMVHVGLGVVSVIVAAVLMRERVGKVEYAVGWMSLAVGAFALMIYLAGMVDAPRVLQNTVGGAFGSGLYYLAVWRGFKTAPAVAGLIAGLQFCFWLLLQVYSSLASVGVADAAATGGAG